MKQGRWGERLIRAGGRVKWYGRWYRLQAPRRDRRSVTPDEHAAMPPKERPYVDVEYDGRLDGRRALFYEYGPRADIDAIFIHSFGEEWPGPHCLDGVFHWERFVPEGGGG